MRMCSPSILHALVMYRSVYRESGPELLSAWSDQDSRINLGAVPRLCADPAVGNAEVATVLRPRRPLETYGVGADKEEEGRDECQEEAHGSDLFLCCRQRWAETSRRASGYISVSGAPMPRHFCTGLGPRRANVTPIVTEIWALQELVWSAERLHKRSRTRTQRRGAVSRQKSAAVVSAGSEIATGWGGLCDHSVDKGLRCHSTPVWCRQFLAR